MSAVQSAQARRWANWQRIAVLAWPVFIGQLAVLSYSTIDTVLVARFGALDLAALAVGNAVYTSVFVGLMGVVLAVSPLAAQRFGAGDSQGVGDSLHQAVWLALALTLLGWLLLLNPEPLLALARPEVQVEAIIRRHLGLLAVALPAALLFTVYRGFNTAVSRPKAVMVLQLGGLALKFPLSLLLIHGAPGLPGALAFEGMGAPGGALSTAIVVWSQLLAGVWLLRHDAHYRPFGLHQGGLHRPNLAALKRLLALGLPMGGSILIEVTGFTFMALFISRFGATAVAGHQLAANLVAMMFMLPMALGNATGALVGQRVGAHDLLDAQRLARHGLELALGLALLLGSTMFLLRLPVLQLYTQDPLIIAAALPLLFWVAVFHLGDAGQALCAAVLRAHHVTLAPMVVYALAIWGVGIGGGYWLAFDAPFKAWSGAQGFWAAATLGLLLTATGLGWVQGAVHRSALKRSSAPQR
ncbi:MATE family efflux transporter [Roseateles sp. BYS180W]|uniref:MATE family efflux transporter n=1 Tax=Roseateles rivi TaxID=3299028 RepID=A0ABW7FUR2_9BURK